MVDAGLLSSTRGLSKQGRQVTVHGHGVSTRYHRYRQQRVDFLSGHVGFRTGTERGPPGGLKGPFGRGMDAEKRSTGVEGDIPEGQDD